MANEYLVKGESLTAVADKIRILNGTTEPLTLDEMAEALDGIEVGVELPTLTNEGSASDLLSGKQLIDSDGNIVTGTIATRTSSNLTASGATVTVPAGYYASQATKSVGTATQATPSITINASGLITATATQTAGYVGAGSKSATKQLAFQAAKTITPTTASQIAVSSGYYTGGNITVKGDSNLVAGNIKSGVSIFGVSGTYAGNGGGDTDVEDSLVTRTVTSYENDRVTSIGDNAFYQYSGLTSVSFPAATTIGSNAFYSCTSLTSVSFPKVTIIGSNAFANCKSLTSVSFPAATSIGREAFYYCSGLTSVSFPAATTIGYNAFYTCKSLTSVSFPKVTTIGSDAFRACTSLTSVSFPKVTTIDRSAFYICKSLTSVSFPAATYIGSNAFANCKSLTSVSFPAATTICTSAFANCTSLTSVSFPAATHIGSEAFYYCSKLSKIYLTASFVCRLASTNVFFSTSIGSNKGSIFVPSSLVASYKAATNWAFFSKRIYSA